MKKILFILTICLVCSTSVLSQSKKKWEQTQSLNSIEAYQDFIKKYPQGKYVESAKQELAQLEFVKAKELNTITAYEDFIKKTSNKQLINEAKIQIVNIQEQEEFIKVKETKSFIDILNFLGKYPGSIHEKELKQLFEKLSYEKAISIGTSDALEGFLKAYPKSEFAEQLNKKIPDLKYSEAISRGTDQALISFIKSCTDPILIKDAISRLKTYQIVDISKTITWENLKTVFCGGGEAGEKKYLCGIDLRFISPGVDIDSPSYFMAGPRKYFEPNPEDSIIFGNWTEFDGYCVKATNINHQTYDKKSYYTKASIRRDGLLFEANSIVLKKVNKVNKGGRMEMKIK